MSKICDWMTEHLGTNAEDREAAAERNHERRLQEAAKEAEEDDDSRPYDDEDWPR